MAVIWSGTSADIRNAPRRTIVSKYGTTYKTKRTYDDKGKLTIAANKGASLQAALQKDTVAPTTVQTATLEVNQGAALRDTQKFSAAGQVYNPAQQVLQPYAFQTDEEYDAYNKSIQRQNEVNKINQMFPERAEKFKEQTEKYNKPKTQYAPRFDEKEFYTLEGQKQASKRAADAVVNALTRKADNKLTVSLGNEKVNLFVEKRLSNAWLTAAEITALKGLGGAVKSGALALAGKGAAKAAAPALTGNIVKRGLIVTGKTLARTPQAFANVAAATSLTTDAVLAGTLTQKEAKALRNPDLRQKYATTLRLQAQEIGTVSKDATFIDKAVTGAKSVGFGISTFLGSKEQFSNIAASQGLNDTEQSALLKMRTAGGFGEISGLLAAGVSGERAGRAAQATFFAKGAPKTFAKGFAQGALTIGPAGFIEGSSGEFAQQFARGERTNFKRIGLAGAVGTASAATFGGVIVGAQSSKRAALSGSTEFIGNILDPFEYPADRLTDFGAAFSRGFRKAPVTSFSFTQLPSLTQTTSKGTKSSVSSLSLTQTPTKNIGLTTSLTQSKTQVNTKSLTDSFVKSNVPSQTNTNPFSFTQSQSFTKQQSFVDSLVNTNTQTNTKTQTDSFVNVPTNSLVTSNVPVINFRLPAAVPMVSVGGGGGGDFSFKFNSKVRTGFSKKPTVYSILAGKPKIAR